MTELYQPIVAENLSFEGLFSMAELFRLMDMFYRNKGFDKKIDFDEEYETPTGKYLHLKTQYYKKVDSYVRIISRLWIYVNDLEEVEVVVDGKPVRTNQGKISITFDGFVQTGYFSWLFDDTKPVYYLFRVIYEKYINRPRIAYWENVMRHISNELKAEMAGYFNIHKVMYER